MKYRSNPSFILLIASMILSGITPVMSFAEEKEAPAAAKKVLVKYERYGGFAGFHDNLTIFEDFTYQLETPRHVKHRWQGNVSDKQKQKLGKLLEGFGSFLNEQSDGPRVADGMTVRIEVNGNSKDKDAKGDKRALESLASKIIMEARKGKRVPK